MSELRTLLEREVDRTPIEPFGVEVLVDRRERKERNRRIRAGALGVIVALATGIFLARSLTSGGVPADPPVEPGPTVSPTPLGAGEILTVKKKNLVAQDPNTGAVRTIVDANALPERAEGITGAAWSPDRRWVAFRAGGLWVADTVGGAPRQLTPDQGWFPWAWSPTEDQLAVVYGNDVTLVDAATGRETDLGTVVGPEDAEGYAVSSLVWSPDGSRVAYDGGPVNGPAGREGRGTVYSIDVESGEHTILVPQPVGTGEIKDIDWSPDRTHLAISYFDASYAASPQGELDPEGYHAKVLYLANADGSEPRLVAHIIASQWPVWIPPMSVGTAWSPDGTRFAYPTLASGPDGRQRESQIWTISVDGTAPTLVASPCCMADGVGPVWSSDGSQLAFEVAPEGDLPHDFLVVDADGSGDQQEIDELTYLSLAGGSYFCRCYG